LITAAQYSGASSRAIKRDEKLNDLQSFAIRAFALLMPVKALDTLLAIKVINLMPGLRQSDRRVGAALIEHYNRKTGRCDPGIGRLADVLGLSSRTIIRSTQLLEARHLFRKVRHGGYSNRNSYEPNWPRFVELERAWRDKLQENARARRIKMSLATGQESHPPGDKAVTQTCIDNKLHQQTCSKGHPKEVIGRARSTPSPPASRAGSRSADAAHTEAERRWSNELFTAYGSLPITYAEVIEAITPEIQSAATDAEIKTRGGGLVFIRHKLKLWGR
jgi:hypothetical protein